MAMNESQDRNSGVNSIYGSIEDREHQRFNQYKTMNDHSKSKSLEATRHFQPASSQHVIHQP